MSGVPLRILLIEDNPADARLLQNALAHAAERFDVTHVETMADAIDRLRGAAFDVVLIDLTLPDSCGIATLERLVATAPHLPMVIMTGVDDEALATEAIRKGAQDYLVKGNLSDSLVIRAIRYARERKAREREIERLNRLYAALSELHQTIIGVPSREELFREVCRIATEKAGFKVAWVGRHDPPTQAVIPVARAGEDQGYVDEIKVYADDRPEGRGAVGTCIREGRPCIFNDFDNDPRSAPWRAAAAARGLRAIAGLPVYFQGAVWGALTVCVDEPNVFQDKEVALLEEAAAAISFALDRLDRKAERQRAEETLRESEQRYRSLFENMLDGFAYCRMLFDEQDRPVDFLYLEVNSAFERLTGLKDVVGKRVTAVIPGIKEASPELFEAYGRVALTGQPEEFEFDLKSMGLWLSISVYSPRKGYFVVVFDNITERKRAEQAIRASEAKYRRLHESIRDAFVSVAMNGRIEECNKAYLEMLGYTWEEIATLTYLDLTPVKWHAMEAEIVAKQVLPRGYSDVYEKEYRKKDGSVFPIELRTILLEDDAGQPCSMWGIVRDITERKKAEEALREANQHLRIYERLVESSPNVVVVVDRGYVYRMANAAFLGRRGMHANEILGHTVEEVLGKEDFELVRPYLDQCMAGKVVRFENWFSYPDLGRRFLEVSYYPLFDENGQTDAVVAELHDATDRKRAEESLERAKVAAEAANRAKSEFLANMSHEIRTPMTAILGFSDLLATPHLPPAEQHEFLEGIQRNGKALLELIGDILDLSRIEADRLTLEKADCPLHPIIDDVLSVVQVRAREKRLSLEVDYQDPLPENVHTDPARLRQILVNLAGNAVKFTTQGEVRIAIRCTRDGHQAARWQFAVSDTGVGIPADKIGGLFQPFTQADTSASRRYGGAGLGLAISQRLAQALGGHIEVASELGKGSTFTLTIDAGSLDGDSLRHEPQAVLTAGEDRVPSGQKSPLHGRLLLVEDDPDLQRLVGLILRKMNLAFDAAKNGQVACEMAEQSRAEGRPYDLILMDIQMPEMNGYEATQQLRRRGWQGPIIALTAHALAGDRGKCLAAGCDDYLAKPLMVTGLRDVLARHLARTAAEKEDVEQLQTAVTELAGMCEQAASQAPDDAPRRAPAEGRIEP